MGIVMRTYVFICLVGVISTMCIVLMTFSNKTSHKIQMSEGSRHTPWQHPRKSHKHRNGQDLTDTHAHADRMTREQLQKVADGDDGIFSSKRFSDNDRRSNRDTASVKDIMEAEEDNAVGDFDTFSVLEDSNMRPNPQTEDGWKSKEANPEDAAAALMAVIGKHTDSRSHERLTPDEPGEKLRSTRRLVSKNNTEVKDALFPRSRKTAQHADTKLVPFDKLVARVTLSRTNAEAQKENLTDFTKTDVKGMSKMERGGPVSMRNTETKASRDSRKSTYRSLTHSLNKTHSVLLDRVRGDEKPVRDKYRPMTFELSPRLRPVAINHNLLRENNISYPVFVKSNTTLTRVLPVAWLPAGICKPQNNLAMLKTHKCSSSTLQNILFRWGDDHNLTFILPKSGPYIGHPEPFDLSLAQRVIGDKYNILANHARYNREGLHKAMPRDTLYFTVLRDPVKQFESAFTYYKFDERYGVAGLRSFLKQPEIYFQREPVYPRQAGRNQMLYDLGLDARFMDDTSPEVRQYMAMIEDNFHLVMIAEHFEESLILLKDLLCWSLDDIVYFNQNARSKSSVRRITASMRREILDWNAADASMYNYFNQTLWKKIEKYGFERMRKEVGQLQLRNEILKKKCIGGKLESHDPRMWYPSGIKVDSFVVNPNASGERLCEQLIRPELTYINILQAKQQGMALRSERRHDFIRRQTQMRDTHSRKFVNFRQR